MKRENTKLISEILKTIVAEDHFADGLNSLSVFKAYAQAAGPAAAKRTVRKYFNEGTLVCYIDSAVVRSSLFMRRAQLTEEINRILGREEVRRIFFR